MLSSMNETRTYRLSSGSDPDAVYKQIIARPCKDFKHHEVLIYEGDSLPEKASKESLRVVHRHPDVVSANRQADDEFGRSLAIGWLVTVEAEV